MRLVRFEFTRAFAGCLLGAWLAAGAAADPIHAAPATDPEPNEIILYQDKDFSAETQRWSLTAEQAYLLVKELDDNASGIGALSVGANVGALLFTLPHFVSRDDRCGPRLGSDANPELWWRGLTTEPIPVRPAGQQGTVHQTELRNPRYRSLIVYRRDLGPPPGALILERRIYYNRSCPQLSHASYYNRVFVPADPEIGKKICFNLSTASQSPVAEADTPKLKRVSDLHLMAPRHLSPDYLSAPHAVEVSLFEKENCSGNAKSFASEEKVNSAFTLQDYGLFRRVRSASIVYGGGAMAGYSSGKPILVARAEPQPISETEAIAEAEPLTTAVGPEESPLPEDAGEATEAASETNAQNDGQAGTGATSPPAPETAEPTEAAGVEKQTDLQAEDEVSVAKAEAAAEASMVPPSEISSAEEPEPEPQAAPAFGISGSEAEAETETTSTAPKASAEPSATQPAPDPAAPIATDSSPSELAVNEEAKGSVSSEPSDLSAESLGTSSSDEAQPDSAAALPAEEQSETKPGSQLFRYPVVRSLRLNFCYRWGKECGEPAAAAFCKEEGYARAQRWKRDARIGALFPTLVLGDDRICEKFLCDGFEEILCSQE